MRYVNCWRAEGDLSTPAIAMLYYAAWVSFAGIPQETLVNQVRREGVVRGAGVATDDSSLRIPVRLAPPMFVHYIGERDPTRSPTDRPLRSYYSIWPIELSRGS